MSVRPRLPLEVPRRVMEKLGFAYGGTARWHDHDVIWLGLDR